ncbi:putative plasma membrane SNARE protein (Sec9) [Aspergillus lucknowensis]|uniref:t-SNARE coiled-coil homology domain-containing protein n=1 Tax=Aspergillus lucknowensis TaxID=176173 RepID=A0ABR4M1D6_9EURO
MRRFGLKKSSDDGDDDSSNRLALFGSRSKSKSPGPSSNPYAKPVPADPYTKAKVNAGVAAPPPNMRIPSDPAPSNGIPGDNKYQIPGDNKYQGYMPNSYGNQSGYGANRYGGGAGAAPASRYGPGGYGGLGSTDPNDLSGGDDNRAALFGGASERAAAQQASAPPPYSEQQQQSGGCGGGSSGYTTGTYQERHLTAEEEEEQEIQAVKQDIRFTKQSDISSTRNALRLAAQAEETGRGTLARLGAQGEMIHDTERHLDVARVEGRIADEKARELKTLNKSMFAVHVSNPFTSAQRQRERDERILSTHRQERDAQAGTRSEAFQTNQRMERTFREIERESAKAPKPKKTTVAERAKYQFEADSEDDAMEEEIDQNLNLLSGATGRLNLLAKATGRELDEQNRHLERIMDKSVNVDDQLAMNRARLDRIR